MPIARTLAQVNKAIQKLYPTIILAKGEGYFYVTSDDEQTAWQLGMLEQVSIHQCYLSQQSVEGWVNDVKKIADEALATPYEPGDPNSTGYYKLCINA